MSPQHGIFIINIVIHIICTIPFATTNHIHHSSYPLPFASISGENDIPQKSIGSYSTNNGEWRRKLPYCWYYWKRKHDENVKNREGKRAMEMFFNISFLAFMQLSRLVFHLYRVCVCMRRRRKAKNLENISHMCCDFVVARCSSIFSFLTFCHSCSFIWQ